MYLIMGQCYLKAATRFGRIAVVVNDLQCEELLEFVRFVSLSERNLAQFGNNTREK